MSLPFSRYCPFRIYGHLDHGPRVRDDGRHIIHMAYLGAPQFPWRRWRGQKYRDSYLPPVWIVDIDRGQRPPSLRPSKRWGRQRLLIESQL